MWLFCVPLWWSTCCIKRPLWLVNGWCKWRCSIVWTGKLMAWTLRSPQFTPLMLPLLLWTVLKWKRLLANLTILEVLTSTLTRRFTRCSSISPRLSPTLQLCPLRKLTAWKTSSGSNPTTASSSEPGWTLSSWPSSPKTWSLTPRTRASKTCTSLLSRSVPRLPSSSTRSTGFTTHMTLLSVSLPITEQFVEDILTLNTTMIKKTIRGVFGPEREFKSYRWQDIDEKYYNYWQTHCVVKKKLFCNFTNHSLYLKSRPIISTR